MATIKATVYEMGNGFPDDGDYVPGTDGELYVIVRSGSRIETGSPGSANRIYDCEIELADWDDVDSEDEVHPSRAVIDEDEA